VPKHRNNYNVTNVYAALQHSADFIKQVHSV